jgi:hypothetical protein
VGGERRPAILIVEVRGGDGLPVSIDRYFPFPNAAGEAAAYRLAAVVEHRPEHFVTRWLGGLFESLDRPEDAESWVLADDAWPAQVLFRGVSDPFDGPSWLSTCVTCFCKSISVLLL